jgi:16S rRNA (cytosine1402-N4)-methyltransferase
MSTERRRPRYRGTHPRRFEEKYKEHDPQRYPRMQEHVLARGQTPAGTHIPVLLNEVMDALRPAPDETAADCTLGYGGHAAEILRRTAPGGRLFGFDVDKSQLDRARERLSEFGARLTPVRGNFAGVGKPIAGGQVAGYDLILADLGVSSMQLDDPQRGFSYKWNGPLDMRMDDRLPRSAAEFLQRVEADELAEHLARLADEPDAEPVARAVVAMREKGKLRTTRDLVDAVFAAKRISKQEWRARDDRRQLHPAARTFQAIRILVNDELGALRQLLRIAPGCLRPGGRIAVISFHSGEHTLVEQAFNEALTRGDYQQASADPVTPSANERRENPRSTSAQLRCAVKTGAT